MRWPVWRRAAEMRHRWLQLQALEHVRRNYLSKCGKLDWESINAKMSLYCQQNPLSYLLAVLWEHTSCEDAISPTWHTTSCVCVDSRNACHGVCQGQRYIHQGVGESTAFASILCQSRYTADTERTAVESRNNSAVCFLLSGYSTFSSSLL
jgi:hypothetical protein